ncbi:hypothetical protein EDC30_10813 [Paucimonas lemoignei]|uniref:Uncharacterized protein n=1 Tax=Paucimonas lemoignei TaxID=29443 RepID=A0A4V2UIF4_PAULE|nr:hypothetical protein [Paucimonas lemoignei]TCS35950.1 hypothetical protein EDC30_10813 [Paucimonas lemoignei]
MSAITIKDLSDSIDLDRKAMLAIVGGARRGGFPVAFQPQPQSEFRLVTYPAGFTPVKLALTQPGK